ncbi:MAG: RNA polymerase subunit sigma-70, partial [Gemmatimonadetes bacterium]|nr:RNA polymerase subunit sigma-70 [Gemmatimonadota bacterium]NIX44745.1 RNA polymerase subunit sigma-70 [Gemmatimonadota bacterium]NIY08986.1 RNA polymerase subunit sigma-70 [Gemmatimonadota bacterium]
MNAINRSGESVEAELVERACAGDEAALHRLYEANVDQVYRLTYRLAGD